MSGQWRTSTRRGRLPENWAALRKQVLERDGGICYLCGGPGADTVDHIRQGDDHSFDNLAPVHDRKPPHCHRHKSAVEGANASKARAAKRYRPREQHPGMIRPN